MLLPPPLALIGEGRRVALAPSPVLGSRPPGSERTFEHQCLYSTPHTNTLLFLGDWTELFFKQSRERVGYPIPNPMVPV